MVGLRISAVEAMGYVAEPDRLWDIVMLGQKGRSRETDKARLLQEYFKLTLYPMKLLFYQICASLQPIRREDDTSAKCCHHEIKFLV